MYKPRLTALQQNILEYLFTYPEQSFTGRAIALSLKTTQPGVSKALPHLERCGLINIKKDRNTKRLSISLNRDNQLVTGIKRAYNLRHIYESGLASFLENEFPGATIVLFGSYSRGDDTSASDIDVAVIGNKEKPSDLTGFESALRRRINLNFFESGKIHRELRQNILNGIVLAGGIEL